MNCGGESPPGFQYCGHCAAPLANVAAERGAGAAERRQLTVVFCDLVGATSLSGQLDPEDLREVLRGYQAVGAAAIERYDGQVAQYLGDGILAYFGYPRAHEDDAQRAVKAGLEIVGDMARLSARFERERGSKLAVRLGIHTGLVVAGEMGGGGLRENLAVGETPNVASRLQSLAEPNTLVISSATHRLVQGYFDCVSRGAHTLKGVSQPMEVYQVNGETGATRLDVAASTGLTALVGRNREVGQLQKFWKEVCGGTGRLVLLSGEAGIGKSRLLETCIDHVDAGSFTRLRYFCSEHHTSSPLYPVICQMERAAGIGRRDLPEVRLGKLEALLAASAPSKEELSLLADLLLIPRAAERFPPLELTPQRRRQKTFAALLRQVDRLAASGPVLMMFEDVHWIDPSSRELLDAMAVRVDQLPILAIITFRPEFQAPWAGNLRAANIVLGRLDHGNRKDLIGQIAAGAALPDRTVREIVERSDGIPLFIEELTRAVLDAGGAEIDAMAPSAPEGRELTVPETLHSSLLARLDRLGTAAKEVAQVGAAIGRQFYYSLLAAVMQRTEAELIGALNALGEAALLTCRGTPPEATYIFKHALVQDAAYATLLRGRRRDLHAAIAKELEQRHSGDAASQEVLAHHCTQAGLHREAVRAWRSAARESVARGSFAEAQAQLRTGMALLERMTQDAERDHQEVTLQNSLGNVLIAQKGYTAPETLVAFERARALAAKLDDPGQGLRALWGLGTALLFAGKLGSVLEMMGEAAPLVEKNGHLDARLAFSVVHGSVLLDLGRPREACEQLERTLAMDSEPGRDRERAILYGQSPRISALGHLSIASLIRGRPEESLEQSRRSLREALTLAHKPILCLAHSVACRRHWLARDGDALASSAVMLQRLAADQGTPLWLALGRIYFGWSLAEQDGAGKGIPLMAEAMREYRASGAGAGMPLFLLVIGRACARAGRAAEAMDWFAEALEGGGPGEERWIEAEVHRARAGVLAAQNDYAAAQDAYRKAIDVAQRQGALLFEARAREGLERIRLASPMQGGNA